MVTKGAPALTATTAAVGSCSRKAVGHVDGRRRRDGDGDTVEHTRLAEEGERDLDGCGARVAEHHARGVGLAGDGREHDPRRGGLGRAARGAGIAALPLGATDDDDRRAGLSADVHERGPLRDDGIRACRGSAERGLGDARRRVRPLPREQHGAEAHLLFDRHHDGERGLADVLRAGEEHLTGRRPHGERAADPSVRGDPERGHGDASRPREDLGGRRRLVGGDRVQPQHHAAVRCDAQVGEVRVPDRRARLREHRDVDHRVDVERVHHDEVGILPLLGGSVRREPVRAGLGRARLGRNARRRPPARA